MIPYSVVQPVHIQTKRPVIFSPSILSHGLIERLLQPAESGLMFNTCLPGTCTTNRLHQPHVAPNASKQTSDSSFDYHMIHHSLLSVVCRAYSGFRETRQDSVPIGFLQSRAGSGHTAAVNTGCYQPGNEKHPIYTYMFIFFFSRITLLPCICLMGAFKEGCLWVKLFASPIK